MDTKVIAMRLQKLDGYLRSLRQMQNVTLDECLDNLTEELADFDQFAKEIVTRFLSDDATDSLMDQ